MHHVNGQVQEADGRPLANVIVRVVSKGLRSEEVWGEARTHADGRFEIAYTPKRDGEAPNLVVRAVDENGNEIVASGVIFNAKEKETVLLTRGGELVGLSEFEALTEKIMPLLKNSDGRTVTVDELKQEDLDFLSGAADVDGGRLSRWIDSMRLAKEASTLIEPTIFSVRRKSLPPSVFYAWLGEGLPTDLSSLLKQENETLRSLLEGAARDRLISASPEQMKAWLNIVVALKASQILKPAGKNDSASVGDLIKVALANSNDLQIVLDGVAKSPSLDAVGLQGVAKKAGLKSEQIARLARVLEMGTFTGNHLPLVVELEKKATNDPSLKEAKGFSKYTEENWRKTLQKLFDAGQPAFPLEMSGANDQEKIGNYAAYLANYFETTYPTRVLASRLEQDTTPPFSPKESTLLQNFFNTNSIFDFKTGPVEVYFKKNPAALPQDEEDQAQLLSTLKRIERLFKLTQRYDQIKALLAGKIHGAQSIILKGENSFISQHTDLFGGADRAQEVFDNAVNVHSLAINLYAKYASEMSAPSLHAIGGIQQVSGQAAAAGADWRMLFGTLDLCDCADCQSVLSPSAYFVDLLKFLEESPAMAGKNPLQVLLARRPDLEYIELTCDNSNTPLPYVDLVNEILEDAISPPTPAILRQTKNSAEELRANPQYVNTAAYGVLANAVYPMDLPFNFFLEEVRTYLAHLGVSLADLTELLLRDDFRFSDSNVAWEHLGLSATEAGIISGTITHDTKPIVLGATNDRPWDFYGLMQNAAIRDPADLTKTIIGSWDVLLQRVDVFLSRLYISYIELLDLLDTYYFNPTVAGKRALQLKPISNDPKEAATCDPSKLKIDGLNAAALTRVHRFVRLWRKVGGTVRDLDRTIMTLSQTGLTDGFLVQLSQLKRLQESLRLPVSSLLAFFGNLDTAVYHDSKLSGAEVPSLYDQLFLNKTVLTPTDNAFLLNTSRTELADPFNPALNPADPTKTITAHSVSVTAALGISEDDLDVWLHGDVTTSLPAAVTDGLNLANLSKLYRYATVARALRFSPRELLALIAMMGNDPFEPTPAIGGAPARTAAENLIRFVEGVKRIQASPFVIFELDYLLRHQATLGSPYAPADDEIAGVLREIRGVVVKASEDHKVVGDPNGTVTREKLLLLLTSTEVQATMSILAGTSTLSAAAQSALIRNYFSSSANPAKFLPDTSDAVVKLVSGPTLPAGQARYEYALGHLVSFLVQDVVTKTLSENLGLEMSVVEFLLTRTTTSARLLDSFLDPTFVNSDPKASLNLTQAPFQSPANAYRRMQKAATLITKWLMEPQEVFWIFAAGTPWLDSLALPVAPTGAAQSFFEKWDHTVRLLQLRDSIPGQGTVLTQLYQAANNPVATQADYLSQLSETLSWNLTQLQLLTESQGLNLTFPFDFQNEWALLQLQKCFRTMKRLGATAQNVIDWAKRNPTAAERIEQARQIKETAKAKYEAADQWNTLAKPLRDRLRDQQRTALVNYLLAYPKQSPANVPLWNDTEGLIDHFLIDVEMSPCMMTSRVKQAIGSVQWFMQRSLMNEEAGVSIPENRADEWNQWRKLYRVWEANRKVFLFPENWIEPELRDDKTEIFEELESELMQDDVSAENVEAAIRHYVEKLGQISRLQPVGLYIDKRAGHDDGPIEVHLFARTTATPRKIYYRLFSMQGPQDRGVWSPWEKVEIDTEGSYLMPVVFYGRLFLFWPVITEATDTPAPPENATQPGNPPAKLWQIQFAWSQRRHGKWSPKNLSQDSFTHPALEKKTVEQTLTFRIGADADAVRIDCYGAKDMPAPPPPQDVPRSADTERPNATTEVKGAVYDVDNYFRGIPNAGVTLTSLSGKWTTVGGTSPGSTPTLLFTPNYNKNVRTDTNGEYSFDNVPPDDYRLSAGTGSFDYIPLNIQKPTINAVAGRLYIRNFPFSHSATFPKPKAPVIDGNRPVLWDYIAKFQFSDPEQGILTLGPGPNLLVILADTQVEGMGYRERANRAKDELYMGPQPIFPVLSVTPGRFRILTTGQAEMPGGWIVVFFEDEAKSYCFLPLPHDPGGAFGGLSAVPFFHPYLKDYLRNLDRDGIDAMLTLPNQLLTDQSTRFATYAPVPNALKEIPEETVEFDVNGIYSQYNWELFFHIPFLIACKLSRNQRFAEAQTWFHYIFDPMAGQDSVNSATAERFWKFRPFHDYETKPPQTLEALLQDAQALDAQITAWRKHPFHPFAIGRLRHVAFMKAVIMRYLDNLIAWADQIFRRDTIESLNEATQLYLLAAHLLGKRPEKIPARASAKIETYNSIRAKIDDLSSAWVQIENYVFPSGRPMIPSSPGKFPQHGPAALATMPLFCVPKNENLLAYWDTIADRLFNIRHCMNIEGVARELPLYEPPIDPAILVRAAAAGVDLNSALNDLNAPLPSYRFTVLLSKAVELCGELKTLGSLILSALEKRDSEKLALLRSGQEIEMLKKVELIKQQQVQEASETKQGLQKTRETVATRYLYYQRLLGNPEAQIPELGATIPDLPYPQGAQMTDENGVKMIPHEKQELEKLKSADVLQLSAGLMDTIAGILHYIPDATTLAAPYGSGNATTTGGSSYGPALGATASVFRTMATELNYQASLAGKMGALILREAEMVLQSNLAAREIMQIDKQILVAGIREAMAQLELANHRKQMDDARSTDEFMHSKFTKQALYDWMLGQVAGVYFQSYQLAYDVAKRAERAYRHELGLGSSAFIQFGYWDSLKKGLLAGEKLHLDLKRMEAAYLDQNKREYEISKHVSLSMLDPVALVNLKTTGTCEVEVTESFFDKDYPGHYRRRLKSVGVTIPCVTGPYTSVNCTLTLLSHRMRVNPNGIGTATDYAYTGPGDARFMETFSAVQSIVTSGAQNDSGLFEMNLRDDRYLPFEGAGAVGRWRLEMPLDSNLFDFSTISDVVLHLRYTARDGNPSLRTQARAALPRTGFRLFNLKHDFPGEWHRFLNPTAGADQVLSFPLTDERFPYHVANEAIRITRVEVYADFTDGPDYSARLSSPAPVPPATTPAVVSYDLALPSTLYRAGKDVTNVPLGTWTMKLKSDNAPDYRRLKASQVKEIYLLVRYERI